MADAPKLGPNLLFAQLEEELDAVIDRFHRAAPTDPAAGEYHLDKPAVRRLSARLISLTSKLHALRAFCGSSLRALADARAHLGDPITDEEIAEHTASAGKFPGVVWADKPAAPSDAPPLAKTKPTRPTHGPDGKPWN